MLNTARALAGALCLSVCAITPASAAWINEFHYDNVGADQGEFVELAGRAGVDLTGWGLLLYNGSNGSLYREIDLVGGLPDADGSGYGFLSIEVKGIQNGPDALALVDASGGVLQFLSYEGLVTAVDGPAMGLVSEDVGVFEPPSTPFDNALALVGVGQSYGDFDWALVDHATPGKLNDGQALSAVPLPGALPLFASALLGLGTLARMKSTVPGPSRSEAGSDEPFSQHGLRLTNLRATLPSPA